MARIVQPWKEAASLIIAARTAKPIIPKTSKPLSASTKKVLEESDYKLLVLKRSSKSKFMPNAYVFPGGLLSEIDYSEKWGVMYTSALGMREQTKLTVANLGLSGLHSNQPTPMYHINYLSPIPNEAIFRICAIRETFEESGMLMCIDKQDLERRSSGVVHKHLSADKRKLLPSLRKEVNADEHKFLQMCEDLQVVPDIWGLVEHSNWLTPTRLPAQASRRYDTAFFTSFITEDVDYEHDNNEVTDAQWLSPAELLLSFHQEKIQIMPPQIYTLWELLTVPSWKGLVTTSLQRLQNENVERIFPVRIKYKDGAASLVKGDYQYPENPDIEGTEEGLSFDSNMEEHRKRDAPLYRFELRGTFQQGFVDNVTDRTKPFSVGEGHRISEALIKDLETGEMDKSEDVTHIS